jgi:hypothetical protein
MMVLGATRLQPGQAADLMPRFQPQALQQLEEQQRARGAGVQPPVNLVPFQNNQTPLKPVEGANDIVPFNQGIGGFQALQQAQGGGGFKFAKPSEGEGNPGQPGVNGQPTHQIQMYGQTVYGDEKTPQSKWVDEKGNNLRDLTYYGILAHEDAHRLTAQQYGIRTSDSVVEPEGDVFNGGHVNLETVEFDKQRAGSEKGYLQSMEHYAKGLIDSSTRPEKDIHRFQTGQLNGVNLNANNFGELSDADKKIAARGQNVLQQVAAVRSSADGQNLQQQEQKQGYVWNAQAGMKALYDGK